MSNEYETSHKYDILNGFYAISPAGRNDDGFSGLSFPLGAQNFV